VCYQVQMSELIIENMALCPEDLSIRVTHVKPLRYCAIAADLVAILSFHKAWQRSEKSVLQSNTHPVLVGLNPQSNAKAKAENALPMMDQHPYMQLNS